MGSKGSHDAFKLSGLVRQPWVGPTQIRGQPIQAAAKPGAYSLTNFRKHRDGRESKHKLYDEHFS